VAWLVGKSGPTQSGHDMAPRTRLASTLDPAKVEHAGVAVGSGRSLSQNRLVVTADAVQAAASQAAAAASQAAASASAADAGYSQSISLTNANNASASATAAAASEAATAAAVAVEAAARTAADALLMPKTGGQFSGSTGVTVLGGPGYANAYGEGTAGLFLRQTDAGANLKTSQIQQLSGALYVRLLNDDFSIKYTPLSFNADGTSQFNGNVTLTGNVNHLLTIEGSSAAFVRLKDTGSSANNKITDIVQDGGATIFRHLNDDTTIKTVPMYFGNSGFVVMPNYMFVGEGGGNGQLRINSGSASTAPWIGWYNSSGQRLGYMGDSNTNLLLWLENGAAFTIGNGAMQIPGWTTAGRPASPQDGYFGRNTDLGQVEFYLDGAWSTLTRTLGATDKWAEVTATSVVDISIPAGARGLRIWGTWAPVSSGQFLCMHTSHGGGVFDNSAGNYSWSYWERIGNAQTPGGQANYNYCRLGAQVQGLDLCPFDVVVTTTDTSGYSTFWARSMGWSGTHSVEWMSSGFRNSTTALAAVRLLSSSGNINRMRYTVEPF
jgi:hypothetical protein